MYTLLQILLMKMYNEINREIVGTKKFICGNKANRFLNNLYIVSYKKKKITIFSIEFIYFKLYFCE